MYKTRLSLLVVLASAVLPVWSQIQSSTTSIPSSVSPLIPSTPAVSVSPSLNTGTPVGAIGTAGTTTQIVPNLANPSGGTSLPTNTSSSIVTGSTGIGTMPGMTSSGSSSSSVTSSSVPGYTSPGSTNLPGYSSAPGTVSFPGTSSTPTPGTPTTGGSLIGGGASSSSSGVLGSGSGSANSGALGTGNSGGLIRTTP